MNLKKIFLIFTLMLGLALTVSACGNKNADSKNAKSNQLNTAKELRVAIQPAGSYAPLYVAKHKGWLEEALKESGVSVKWTSFNAGPPENESFAAGQQDIGVMGDVPAIVARAAGQDTRIIGIASYGPRAFAVVIPADSKITNPKDLKGKKVALVKGSYAHQLLVLVLQKAGLTTDDIQALNMEVGDMQNALARKEIDAALMWEPNITRGEEANVLKVLADGTDLKRGELVIMARDEFVSQNPEITKIFLQVYKRSSDYIKENPEEASKLIADDFKLQPKPLEKVLSKYYFTTFIEQDDIKELKKSADFLKQEGLIKSVVDINKFVDQKYQQGISK